jgi:uncharacterized protein YjbJ (UPF0337 family)
MLKETLMSQWPQVRGQIKARWGLADADLDQINGDYEILVSRLQVKTGKTREEIEREISTLPAGTPAKPEPASKPR